jgi:glycosyltransferase involved in cell wall biosynthesis
MIRTALPQVGVIIANYNNEAYVEEAIRSVAAQSFRNLSAVVVDNCSSDSSDPVIRRTLETLKDDRFRYVRNDYNRGQAGAMRTGLAQLDRAAFVCVLDSDDYLYENFVARHLEAHLNTDFPVALSFCDSHIVDGAGRILAGTAWWFDADQGAEPSRQIEPLRLPKLDSKSGELIFPVTGAARLNPTWAPDQASNSMASMMLRRAFVDLVLIHSDEDLKLYLDFYFSTLAALLTGTIGLSDALYAYRMHGANNHSNEAVVGGRYNPSKKQWEPIRDSVWRLVLRTLEGAHDRVERSFGAHKVAQATRLIQRAIARDTESGWRAMIRRLQHATGCSRFRKGWKDPTDSRGLG